ncbi:MAG: GH116 family glycosyl hydrolase [candidate division KSB1 bacterium]|nr:GH116 family glycosyl hydrolase [candidate division KSB1 bacterium]MDZ7333851.1 GH116 family glycosyl hydrolase [candidate division KSB1 bacterium]MDZ7356094.1 GH116 family glycosyl hydrolase [candidate division KSB1 bacterium]MDZ7400611.1 GH116 family glycosyl hydrolase [candidate division KSB1 bacterium]
MATSSVQKFEIYENPIQLTRRIAPGTYCESVGRQAAIFGEEQGIFEVWVYPIKILSKLQFSVAVPRYQLFLNATDLARHIIARPEMTTLIFSHDLFTIQWHILTPLDEPGAIFLFDIDSYVGLELWISFYPALVPMWPAGLGGQYTLWLDHLNAYYIGEGSKKYVGLIGSPFATRCSNTPGHQLPDEPMKFVIGVDQQWAQSSFIPIIVTGSLNGKDDAMQRFMHLLDHIPELYKQNFEHAQRLRSELLSIRTPDAKLNRAFEWAKASLDKGRVDNPQLGSGLVAGYGVSGNSHRPGFAWFFGGDAFLNSLAINCYGDFETTRLALTMLRDRQRSDGKIFHELTQSASFINWFQDYPYGFYHAETSAYYIVAMHDYFISSGDVDFIRKSWNSIKLAYHYCLTADEDQDGLMENSAAGLAAMEVGEMLKHNRVDVYLAAIWLQALRCMIRFCDFFQEKTLLQTCQQQLDQAYRSFLQIFIDEETNRLNFALLTNGDRHKDQTVWQSIPLFFDLISDEAARGTLEQFACAVMSTDWGVRGVVRTSSYYDPISYNNGSVWPFTTGYVATAQYRHHRAINGWHNLLANARLTELDALGWHTELLSGEFYRPVSTSVPHQLFSATGIILPLVSGLLGLRGDSLAREIVLSPHLPTDWDHVAINHFRCGEHLFDFILTKDDHQLRLKIINHSNAPFTLNFSPAFGLGTGVLAVSINGNPANFSLNTTGYDIHCQIQASLAAQNEILIDYRLGIEFEIPFPERIAGSRSQALKLIDYQMTKNQLYLIIEGRPGNQYDIPLKTSWEIHQADGATIERISHQRWQLIVKFANNSVEDFVRKTVTLQFSQ